MSVDVASRARSAAFFVAFPLVRPIPMPTKTAPELKTATRATTKPQIFIDGEAGTTGLAIRQLLAGVTGLGVKSLSTAERKDTRARLAIMREVDLVVLCLPDAAPRIVDGSTAHRLAQGWVYGFAEMAKGQTAAIQSARRVSNPGCYPTGAI